MPEVKDVIERFRPLLEEYLLEKTSTEQQITRKGTVPTILCEKCPSKNIVKISKFGNNSQQMLIQLLSWMQTNDIRALQSDGEILAFRSTKKAVEDIEGTIPLLSIGVALEPSTEKVMYEYRISIARLGTKGFHRLLKAPFAGIKACVHLKREILREAFPVVVTIVNQNMPFQTGPQQVEQLWGEKEETNRLELLCNNCYAQIDSLGCEDSVRRAGFIYKHNCPVRRLIIKRLLEKSNTQYLTSEAESFRQGETAFYLPEFGVLLTDTYRDIEETVKVVKPSCVLAFAGKQELIRFLGLGTHIVVFDEDAKNQQFIIFDHDVKVEQSIDKIVTAVIERLDKYSSEVRGKEHDRLIAAFQRIGQDLGFTPQSETSMKGTRVDVTWLNPEGEIDVAIEIETSAQWKKDVVTTWETEPRLAVILVHYKTGKVVSDAVQYNLLQYMPHKLLLINYPFKKAYLIEKGNIVKTYDLKSVT